MNESTNNPPGERTGIGEAVTTALRQPSFLRVMLVLAATVVVLVGIRLGAPILNPIFFAVVLTVLFSPVYSWLKRRGLPAPLALLIMLVLLSLTDHSQRNYLQITRSKFLLPPVHSLGE